MGKRRALSGKQSREDLTAGSDSENHETTVTDSCPAAMQDPPNSPRASDTKTTRQIKKASTWRSKPRLNVELNKGVELQDVYIMQEETAGVGQVLE